MRFFQPLLDRRNALERLERRRFKRVRRLAGAAASVIRRLMGVPVRPTEFRRPLPYVELVWLPYYLVRMDVSFRGSPKTLTSLVSGRDGQFAVSELPEPGTASEEGVRLYPPLLDEARAAEIAHTGLVSTVLRTARVARGAVVGDVRTVEPVQYPFWVCHYERRRGRLDISVLDAVTGKWPGPRIKTTILQAFVQATDFAASMSDMAPKT